MPSIDLDEAQEPGKRPGLMMELVGMSHLVLHFDDSCGDTHMRDEHDPRPIDALQQWFAGRVNSCTPCIASAGQRFAAP
jgi:hypothetical protein